MTSHSAHLRLSTVGVAAVLALGLSACSSSTSGSGSAAGSSGSGSSSASGSSSTSTVAAAGSASELGSQLASSASKGTSVHLTLATEGTGSAASAASSAGTGEGDVRTADGGKAEAFQFAIGSGDTALSLVYADGTGYVKLPTAQQTDPSKPWAKVSDTSTNPVVKAISSSFDQINDQTSLAQYSSLLQGATNFQATGETTVNGTKARGYSFDVDPSSLPTASQFGDAVSQLGPIPTTMTVDDQGRLLQAVEKISISGQTITTTVTFSDYGKTVDISAPSADQISAD